MKFRNLLFLVVILALGFGVAFLLIPQFTLSLFGVNQDQGTVFLTRLYGSSLVFFGLVAWFFRNVADKEAQRALMLAFFIAEVVGLVVSLQGTLSGVMNAFGWTAVLVYLVLTLGFAYFLFIKKAGT